MFDLPSMLGEYLLPLLLLVPLAVVVVLVVTRQQKEEEPWQQRPVPPPAAPRAAPVAFSPASGEAAAASVPAAPQGLFETTEPAALERAEPATPFVATGQALAETPVTPVGPQSGTQAGPLPLLVVDDSAVVRAKLAKLLGGAGYAVTLARHGHEAIEQLNQHWFALMITDLEMPEMDGFELIAQVSNDLRTENLPIVAITGHEALQAKVQDARGLFGIFKKPWNDRELLARVEVLSRLRPRAA